MTRTELLLISHRFVFEKPRMIQLPADLQRRGRMFILELGKCGDDDYQVTIGETLEEALPRFAEIVARNRLSDAHRARSWSE